MNPGTALSCKIFAASSQFAFEYYQDHVDEPEGRLAIEALYGAAMPYLERRYGSFEAWARQFVPKFRDRSGLVMYFEAPSVDEARKCFEIWRALNDT